jgi:hypothetical protein
LSTPSVDKPPDLIESTRVFNTLVLSIVLLTCNKGPNGNFVKDLSWYNEKEGRVQVFNLDNDKVGGTSRDCALAIKHSMYKFYGNDDEAKHSIWGQCRDSGGGGTGHSFSSELKNEELTIENNEVYLVSFCTLHCIQLSLGTPLKAVLGEGGMTGKGTFRATAMQLLHGVYNLQDNHEREEWQEIWRFAASSVQGEEVNKSTYTIPAPIVTR